MTIRPRTTRKAAPGKTKTTGARTQKVTKTPAASKSTGTASAKKDSLPAGGFAGYKRGSAGEIMALALARGGTSRTNIMREIREQYPEDAPDAPSTNWSVTCSIVAKALEAKGGDVQGGYKMVMPAEFGDPDDFPEVPAIPKSPRAPRGTKKAVPAKKSAPRRTVKVAADPEPEAAVEEVAPAPKKRGRPKKVAETPVPEVLETVEEVDETPAPAARKARPRRKPAAA